MPMLLHSDLPDRWIVLAGFSQVSLRFTRGYFRPACPSGTGHLRCGGRALFARWFFCFPPIREEREWMGHGGAGGRLLERFYRVAGGVVVGSLPGSAGFNPGIAGTVFTSPLAASLRLMP